MKILKRLTGCLLAGILIFALASCGQQAPLPPQAFGQNQREQTPESVTESQEPEASQPDTADSRANDAAKTLVAFYSATGSTKAVASYIADTLEADIFEISPKEPYTSEDLNWGDKNSRVSREHGGESPRIVELTTAAVENWDDYDTVFIGYPIWWGIAAWPVDGFLTANDFTGKTVIPFCTSSSSGLGESGKLLAEQAGTGNWREGRRFPGGVSQADVVEWVDGLEF